MTKIAIVCLLLVVAAMGETDYTPIVNDLKVKITQAPWKHSSWDRLAYLTDTYGPRMWGSVVLEKAIDEMKKQATDVGFENVRLEPVSDFTKWVRGKESLRLLTPRDTKLDVIGLGGSVSSNGPIVA